MPDKQHMINWLFNYMQNNFLSVVYSINQHSGLCEWQTSDSSEPSTVSGQQ